MKKFSFFALVVFFSALFVACLSTPDASSELPAGSEPLAEENIAEPADNDVPSAQAAEIPPNPEVGESSLSGQDLSALLPADEIPVTGTDLSDAEARQLFGAGSETDVSVTANWDSTPEGNIAQNKSTDDDKDENVLIVSPSDLHARKSGEDSLSMQVNVLSDEEGNVLPVPVVSEDVVGGDAEESVAEQEMNTPSGTPPEETSPEQTPQDQTPQEQPVPAADSDELFLANAVEPDSSFTETPRLVAANPAVPLDSVPVTPVVPSSLPATSDDEEENVPLETSTEEEFAESDFAPSQMSVPQSDVVPSRSVHMDNRQYLDIVYPGAGWIYLGELAGENSSGKSSLFTYFGRRRNSSTDTSFTLRSTAPGETILHFYKQDVLTATFIDDYVRVTVSSDLAVPGSRVEAPAYSELVPPYQYELPSPEDFVPPEIVSEQDKLSSSGLDEADVAEALPDSNEPQITADSTFAQVAPSEEEEEPFSDEQRNVPVPVPASVPAADGEDSSASVSSVTTLTSDESPDAFPLALSEEKPEQEVLPEVVESEVVEPVAHTDTAEAEADELSGVGLDLLSQAQEAFYREDYSTAADLLEQFFAVADSQIDAGLYLNGQVFEAKSDIQNIRTALASYKQIVEQYPQSPFWQRAKNRVTYLSRFYFDIR